jgi:signal transduction histidine kinase
MLFLVRDILDFAQIESQSLVLSFQAINLQMTIQECVDALSFKAQEKGIRLKHCPGHGIPLDILSDSSRLMQIVINLLSNAIKYT